MKLHKDSKNKYASGGSFPPEENKLPPEFQSRAEEFPLPETVSGAPKEDDNHHKRMKKLLLISVAAAASSTLMIGSFGLGTLLGGKSNDNSSSGAVGTTAVSIEATTNASGGLSTTDISEYETTVTTTPELSGASDAVTSANEDTTAQSTTATETDAETTTETESAETPDSTFPDLASTGNDSGEIDDGVIWLDKDGESYYIFFEPNAANYGITVVEVPGVRYDNENNTIYLSAVSGYSLNISIHGKPVTIVADGPNELEFLNVWGVSAKISGSGSLTVNKNNNSSIGINLDSEGSSGCLMVDKNVTLECYGTDEALMINECHFPDRGLFWLSSSELTGGTLSEGVKNGEGYDYTVLDENGNSATYFKIAPKS